MTEFAKKSFHYTALETWNDALAEIRELPPLQKTNLKCMYRAKAHPLEEQQTDFSKGISLLIFFAFVYCFLFTLLLKKFFVCIKKMICIMK